MAVLDFCWDGPSVDGFSVEVVLRFFLRDKGTTDGVVELSRSFIRILGDVDKIAAESVLIDEVLDLQRKPQ